MIQHVAVVVPAADEQDHIEAALDAITVAQHHLYDASAGAVSSKAVVVLDDCHDDTAQLVAEHLVDAVISAARRVGAARRLGTSHLMRDAAARGIDLSETWLASTDADSRVAPDWLSQMVRIADSGADLVLGTVVPGHGLPVGLEAEWRRRHNMEDGHSHIHGANLGIRASTYTAVHGWPRLASGEDAALVERVITARRYRIHRTGQIPVVTSTRADGRAPHGFSSYLRALEPSDSLRSSDALAQTAHPIGRT